MQFYNLLEQETRQSREYLLTAPIIDDVFAGRFDINTYLAFLNQAYHHVRHTVPLLMQAGAKLASHQQWMQSALADYISEEKGHEQWILDDIEVCGGDRAIFSDGCAPFDSEVMVSYLYDTVTRNNPVGVFGMVLVLEGTSSSLAPEVAKIVQSQLDLPDKAMTYLHSHGELDQEHIQHFQHLMNRLEDDNDRASVIHVARTVYRLYGNVYRAIPSEAEAISLRSAA